MMWKAPLKVKAANAFCNKGKHYRQYLVYKLRWYFFCYEIINSDFYLYDDRFI